MKALFSLAVLLVAAHSTSAAVYTGEIEKITEPILLKIAPHSIKIISTKQILLTVDGISREVKNESVESHQAVTNAGAGFHFSTYFANSSAPSEKKSGLSMDMDTKGTVSNIEGLKISDEEQKQLVINALTSSLTCHLNVEIRTGTIICKRNSKKLIEHISKKIDLKNGTLPEESAYEVEGWTTYEGRKVIVTSHRAQPGLVTASTYKVPVNFTGYQLIDPKTTAILFSTTTGTMEAEIEGKNTRLEMKDSMAATYQ